MNSKPFGWLGLLWLASAAVAVGVGWQRSHPLLMVLGILMLLVAAWNVVAVRKAR